MPRKPQTVLKQRNRQAKKEKLIVKFRVPKFIPEALCESSVFPKEHILYKSHFRPNQWGRHHEQGSCWPQRISLIKEPSLVPTQKEGVTIDSLAALHHCYVFPFLPFWMGIFFFLTSILFLLHMFIWWVRIVFEFVALQTLRGHIQTWWNGLDIT